MAFRMMHQTEIRITSRNLLESYLHSSDNRRGSGGIHAISARESNASDATNATINARPHKPRASNVQLASVLSDFERYL